MSEMRFRDDKIVYAPKKTGLNRFEHPSHSNRIRMSGKVPRIQQYILSLRSTPLDVDELSYDKVLLLLLTNIYIYRLAPTRSKAHRLNKACREKVI